MPTHRALAILGCCILAVISAPSARAGEPAVVSDIFLAGDDPVDETRDKSVCRNELGVTHRVRALEEDLADRRTLVVDRVDPKGQALEPVSIDVGDLLWGIDGIACAGHGSFLVQSLVYGPDLPLSWKVRAYDADGTARGDWFVLPFFDIDYAPSGLAIHDELGIYSAWADFDWSEQAYWLYGRWLDYDGAAVTETERLSHAGVPWRPSVAIDEAGNVLVVWANDDDRRFALWARAVDVSGALLGDPMLVSDRELRSSIVSHAVSETAGLFRVTWRADAYGGRVGALVSVDPDSFPAPATTTTTLPAGEPAPSFGSERTVGSLGDGYAVDMTYLAGDGHGTWLAAWTQGDPDPYTDGYWYRRWVLAASSDMGATWSPVDGATVDWSMEIAAAANGTWAVVTRGGDDAEVIAHLSRDGGVTWQSRVVGPLCVPPLRECSYSDVDLATDGDGRWVIAWYDHRYVLEPRKFAAATAWIATSSDDGETWEAPRALWTSDRQSDGDIALATDGAGSWIVAWLSDNYQDITVAHSGSDAAEWSAPEVVLHVPQQAYSDPSWRHSLSLVHVTDQSWAIAFASSEIDPARFGADGDVFVLRSQDSGATWSEPEAINSYASMDAGTDDQPSIAAAGGELLAAWRSHDPVGGPLEPNSDVLIASSSDAGRTWGRPHAIDALPDVEDSGYPDLAGMEDGSWMLAWRAWPHDDYADKAAHELRIMTSPALCGDGMVQADEACDDGNRINGDGCDIDCGVSRCGNGILSPDEECDDGDPFHDDECLNDCRLARCGDGVVYEVMEYCDDGATTTSGACMPDCTPAGCGDGHLWVGVEECDDGNELNDDDCTHICTVPVCGDGIDHPTEICDGGAGTDGSCVNCRPARCGDGHVWRGVEDCEPGGPLAGNPCNIECGYLRACEEGSGAGLNATAALSVLRFAVGLPSPCTAQTCDFNGSGRVTSNDALHALRIAVGDRSVAGCTQEVTVRLRMEDTRIIGALDVRLRYPWQLGTFDMGDRRTSCTLLEPRFLHATNARVPGELNLAFVAWPPLPGPMDLIECRFRQPVGTTLTLEDLSMEVLATYGSGAPLDPLPVIEIDIR